MIRTFVKLFLVILTVSVSFSSFSQKGFQKGYIVNANNDTLTGLLENRNWKTNPKSVAFKNFPKQKPIIYTPSKIKAFAVGDQNFVSGFIKIETSKVDVNYLKHSKEFEFETDSVFLKTIFDGYKSLYLYHDKNEKEHFYFNKGNTFELLLYKKYLKKIDVYDVVEENKEYIKQLQNLFNDCIAVHSDVPKTKYNYKSLYSIFKKYYNCPKPKEKREPSVIDNSNIHFGIQAGLAAHKLNFSSDEEINKYLSEAKFSGGESIYAGLFLDVFLTPDTRKWSINNELMYSSFKVNGEYREVTVTERYVQYNTTIGYSQIKINNMVRLRFPISGSYFFMNLGITNSLAISGTNYLKKEIVIFSFKQEEEGKAVNSTKIFEQGLLFGTGLKHRRITLELRAERGNGMSNSKDLKSSTTKLAFMLGYTF